MSFVKLDTGILHSSLWCDAHARTMFITALLMAEPREVTEPLEQIQVRKLESAGWEVPPGWYGFIAASSLGIIRMAGLDQEAGWAALERLGSPEIESRTPDHGGRRLVRVDGGFIALNYFRYRDKDHTSAARQRRFRERKKSNAVTAFRNGVTKRNITQADAEAYAENTAATPPPASPPPTPGIFDTPNPPRKPIGPRSFSDWRIAVGRRIYWSREEDETWKAMYEAEGWDEMTRGYEYLTKKKPDPAKIFLSDFQAIR